MNQVREPACAGRFYSASEAQLRSDVQRFFTAADSEGSPRAVIAPHAGYVFSGAVAGQSFAALAGRGAEIERVVVVGPSHFVGFEGLSVSPHEVFRTPLGDVDVDTQAAASLVDAGLARFSEEPHAREHSLETHLPFLQVLLEDIQIVPVVTGRAEGQAVARALEQFWDDESTVFSISSDLSHFHTYDEATEIDAETANRIEHLKFDAIGPNRACGYVAVRGLLELAAAHGLDVDRLALCNSGDTAGDKDRVVGYGAWAVG